MNKQELKEQAEINAQALSKSLLRTRNIVRIVLIILLIWYASNALFWILGKLTGITLLVILAIFLAYLLDPLVDMVQKPFESAGRPKMMPRPLAIAIVYLGIFVAVGTSLYIVVPKLGDQISAFVGQFPSYKTALQAKVNQINQSYQYNIPEKVRGRIRENAEHSLESASKYLLEALPEVLLKLLEYLPWTVLIPILAFFMLKDASGFHDLAVQAFPSGVWRARAEEFFQDVNRTLAAYIRAQLIACFLIGTICFIGFYFIGLPYALLLAVIAGFLEFIPLVGPLVVAIIATSLASYYSVNQALAVLVFLFILRIVHDYVTYPRIIREGIHLHPIAVILAILAGTELAGITGVFLAIPVVALVTVAYRHWVKSRGGTGLVADILQEEQVVILASADSTIAQGGLVVNVSEREEIVVEVERMDETKETELQKTE
jgi:predicted PurR-regulated permease PerM